MSVRTVAWKDLTSVRRSRVLWGGITLLGLLMVVVAYSFRGYYLTPREQVLHLFRTLTLGLGVIAPLIALVVSYLAIAGERQTGGIKFLLSMPNTRRDVFLGKLASRLLIVGCGLAFAFLTATLVAVATHGALPFVPILGLFVVSFVYVAVFVVIAVALSAAVATRGRAIAGALASYFFLVLFFVVPGLQLSAIVSYVHQKLFGLNPNPNLYDAVSYISPYTAFQKAANLVFPPEYQQTVFFRGRNGPHLPWYLSNEMSFLVFAVWLAVPLLIGYLKFDRTDLD